MMKCQSDTVRCVYSEVGSPRVLAQLKCHRVSAFECAFEDDEWRTACDGNWSGGVVIPVHADRPLICSASKISTDNEQENLTRNFE